MLDYDQISFSYYLKVWNQYECVHKNPEILLDELRKKFPFDEKPLRLNSWDIPQAVLIYYGLNPKMIAMLDKFALVPLLSAIDSECLVDLLTNHLGHIACPAQNYVLVRKFVSFLKEKKVPVPMHLHIIEEITEEENEIEVSHDEEETKTKTRFRKESHRRDIMRYAADLFWRNQKNKDKKFISPTALARSDDMNKLVALINKIGEIPAIQGDDYDGCQVDPEWFSDLFPGEKKPGPKSNISKINE